MISVLRKKFILINMLLVFLVLAVVFSAFCISSYRQAQSESRTALQMALTRYDGHKRPVFEVGKRPPENFVNSPLFAIQIDEDGISDLIFAENISVTDVSLQEITGTVISSEQSEGILKDYNLRFMKKEERGTVKVAFIEISAEQASIHNTVLISSLSMLAALLAFFVISLFLSRWVLRPVEQAWQQQRRFIADASHELKTPLTVILANIGILKANRSDSIEKQLNWIENTEAEAEYMKKLVDNLLFLAKSDDVKTPIILTRVNLSDLVLSSSLAFESLAFERGLSLETDELTPDIYVKGDETQLRQLVSILLDNAVKYSEEHGTVSVSLKSMQSKAVFSVHNNGQPLSPEDMEHSFERFYRADKSRSTEGYGLGLAIAKSIVKMHHGKISVESSAEYGTAFFVILPID